MGRLVLYAIGFVGPFFLIKYRETLGDTLGEAEWMKRFGGVYNVIVIVAVIIFFWTLADATGTTGILFSPVRRLFPSSL